MPASGGNFRLSVRALRVPQLFGGILEIPVVVIMVFGILLWFVLPFLFLLLFKSARVRCVVCAVALALFAAVLCVGVFSEIGTADGNLVISFDFSFEKPKTVRWELMGVGWKDVVVNLLMLIPAGEAVVVLRDVALSRKTEVSAGKAVVVTFLILLAVGALIGTWIELMQFVLPIRRVVQLSDALLNTCSVLIGGAIGSLYLWLTNKIRKI